jgi:hypothetical protein
MKLPNVETIIETSSKMNCTAVPICLLVRIHEVLHSFLRCKYSLNKKRRMLQSYNVYMSEIGLVATMPCAAIGNATNKPGSLVIVRKTRSS